MAETPYRGYRGDTREQAEADRRVAAAVALAGKRLPPHAPASAANAFDPLRSLYNAKRSNTRRIRSGIARAVAGKGLTRHLILGDSTTDYYMGADGSDPRIMWPRRMLAAAAARGVPKGGSGMIITHKTGSGLLWDPRWSFTGQWNGSDQVLSGGLYMYTNVNGATATLQPVETGTAVFVRTFGASAPLKVSIDGGAPITVNPVGPDLEPRDYVVATGLADTTHSIVVTSSSNVNMFVVAAGVLRTSGLVVDNVAITGSKLTGGAGWLDTTSSWSLPNLVLLRGYTTAPDALWLPIGLNDIDGGVTPEQVAIGHMTLRNQFPNSDAVLVAQYQPHQQSQAAWDSYVGRLYTLADTLDVPLLDLYARSGGYTNANADGLMGDELHPSAAAQADWGLAAAALLAA